MSKRSSRPQFQLFLACLTTRKTACRVHCDDLQFSLGAGVRAHFRGDDCVKSACSFFASAGQMWEWATAQLPIRKQAIVWVTHAVQFIPASGFFTCVDQGKILLAQPAFMARSNKAIGSKARGDGPLLILSAACTAIKFWTHYGRRAMVLDLANYFGSRRDEWMPLVSADQGAGGELSIAAGADGLTLRRTLDKMQAAAAIVCDVVQESGGGTLRLTAPAQALASHSRQAKEKLILPHGDQMARDLERSAYFGGLVRPFWVGPVLSKKAYGLTIEYHNSKFGPRVADGMIHELDAVAMYGAIMRDEELPCKLLYYGINPSLDELHYHASRRSAIAKVYLRTDTPFPARDSDGKCRWATGAYWTALCGEELAYACELDIVCGVSEIAVYQLAKNASAWTGRMLALRGKADAGGLPLKKRMLKLMVNGLHGKVSQKQRRWIEVPGECPPDRWGQWADMDADSLKHVQYRALNWQTQILEETDNASKGLVAFGSYVSAIARMRLRAAIAALGKCPCYYVDTDSVHTDSRGADLLDKAGMIDPSSPGKWKDEGQADKAVYYSPRQYRFGDAYVLAGLPKSAALLSDSLLTYELTLDPLSGVHSEAPNASRLMRCVWRDPWQREDVKSRWCTWSHHDSLSVPFGSINNSEGAND